MAFRSVPAIDRFRGFLGLSDVRLNGRKFRIALLLIIIGVSGRLLLLNLANIETVLVASLLAGTYLGGAYVVIVPISIMLATDVIVYLTKYPGFYPLGDIALIAVFVYSGYVMVSLLGATVRRRMAFRLKSVAVLTGISIPATILYDVWTATGMWVAVFSKPPFSHTLLQTFANQVPFTCLHLISSLIFVPIFGTIFIYYLTEPEIAPSPSTAPTGDSQGQAL